jgi:hypothetical protein
MRSGHLDTGSAKTVISNVTRVLAVSGVENGLSVPAANAQKSLVT